MLVIEKCTLMQPRAKRSLASHLSGYKPKRRKAATSGGELQQGVERGAQRGVGEQSVCQVPWRRFLDGESPQLSGGGGGGADGKGWGCPCPGSQESIPVS